MRLIVALAVGLCLSATPALAQNGRALPLSAEAVLLLDREGKVLYAKNPAGPHAPASLVKLMTLYLAFEDIEQGRTRWDEAVMISRRAAETPRYRMGLRPGETVPLSTLLEGVAIASANDAATAVAEHLAGTEEAFILRMNGKAVEMGLTGTRFANPHGLPDPLQRTTAEDMARLIGLLVTDHPASRTVLGGKTFIYRGRVYNRQIPLFDDPGGVQALKTGFTNESGYNLAIAAWPSGQHFLLVVLGAHSRWLSFRDARWLLGYGLGEDVESAVPPPPSHRATPARRTTPVRRSKSRPHTAG